jgi:hypothetical protein
MIMTHEEKQIHNAVHAELREFEEFKELVRKMREAQREHAIADMKLRYHQQADREIPDDVWNSFACTMDWMVSCEDAVDEYLKKMEV